MLLQQQNDVNSLCEQLATEDWFTLDTEFFREKTYFAELCLIQVSTPTLHACIDPKAGIDLSPLFALLADTNITKVLHSAYQDLEILHQLSKQPIRNLFDTQLAAPLLGLPEMIGYAKLVSYYLGIELDKSQVRTDWRKRPLSKAQIEYALGDVTHLATIYPQMRETLIEKGRWDWLREELVELESPDLFITDPQEAYKRVKGVNTLSPEQLNSLRALAAWREKMARSKDLPRRQIATDEVLTDVVKLKPKTAQDFSRIRGFSRSHLNTEEALKQLALAAQLGRSKWPKPFKKPARGEHFDGQLAMLSAVLVVIGEDEGVAPSVIANQKNLAAFIDNPSTSSLLQGWRRLLAGEKLLKVLRGEIGLVLNDGKLRLLEET